MKNPYSGLRNIPKNIWVLSFATLINRAGTMVLPFIALYARQEINVSTGDAGLVLACYGIGAFISSPFSGRLSDRLGTLMLMKVSLFSSGLFLIAYSFVTNFILFLVLSFLWAVLSEAFRPASLSFISSQVASDRRKTAFALNRLAINLGMSVGPVIGGLLSSINFSLLFYVDGITSIAAGIFILFFPWQETVIDEKQSPEMHSEPERKVSVFRNKKFIYFMLVLIPVEMVFFQHIGAMPLFIVNELGFSNATFGILIAINTVLIIFIEVPLNESMRLWEDRKSLALGSLLAGVGFGIMALTETLSPIVISIVIWTFGEMILFPASGDFVAKISPEKQRGEYMGYFQMSFSFAFMIGPWLGAEVLEHFGSFNLWIGCLALGLFSAIMMWRLRNNQNINSKT